MSHGESEAIIAQASVMNPATGEMPGLSGSSKLAFAACVQARYRSHRGPTPPSSGRAPAGFACLRTPLMSNVRCPRSEHTTGLGQSLDRASRRARSAVNSNASRLGLAFICSTFARRRKDMNGGLGRPSVGGRLAAGGGSLQAGCLSDHGFGRSESVSYSRSCVRAVHPRWLVPCVARASRFKLAEQGVRVSRGPAEYRSAEARAGLGAGGYSRAEWRWPASAARMQRCSTSRHLTPPSSGRSKGRSAPFGPPLMSNVRSRLMRRHTRCTGQSPSSFSTVLERHERQHEAVQAHAFSSASIAEREALPGPPVRWRSAHRRCSASQFSMHGRPELPSVGR